MCQGDPSLRSKVQDLLAAHIRPDPLLDVTSAPASKQLNAVNLGPQVNTLHVDQSPFISVDGSTLYFPSPRPARLPATRCGSSMPKAMSMLMDPTAIAWAPGPCLFERFVARHVRQVYDWISTNTGDNGSLLSAAILRISSVIRIEQYLGPHMLQK